MLRRIALVVDTEKVDVEIRRNGGGEDIFAVGDVLMGTDHGPDMAAEREKLGIVVESQEILPTPMPG